MLLKHNLYVILCNVVKCQSQFFFRHVEFMSHFVSLSITLPAATQTSLFQVCEINSRCE